MRNRGIGEGVEVAVVVLVLALALVGGGVAFVMWGRAAASRAAADAQAAEAAAQRAHASALKQMRDADQLARHDETEAPAEAESTPGPASDRVKIIEAAVVGADTPERKAAAREVLDRTALDLEAGKLQDRAGAVAELQVAMGRGYRVIGDQERALKHLRAGVDGLAAALGENHPKTVRARTDLEEVNQAGGHR
jgi:hypothetical protein